MRAPVLVHVLVVARVLLLALVRARVHGCTMCGHVLAGACMRVRARACVGERAGVRAWVSVRVCMSVCLPVMPRTHCVGGCFRESHTTTV